MVYIKTNTYFTQRFVSRCGDLQGEGLQLIARFFARAVLVVGEGGIKGLTDGVDRQSWYERMNEGDEKKLPVAKQVFGAVSTLGHYFVPFVERIGRVCQANQGFLSKAKLADF